MARAGTALQASPASARKSFRRAGSLRESGRKLSRKLSSMLVGGNRRTSQWLKQQQAKDVKKIFQQYEIEDKVSQLRARGPPGADGAGSRGAMHSP